MREATETDKQAITDVVLTAFGDEEGRIIADLITDLRTDPSARPLLSLVATNYDHVVGHILFTNARIQNSQRAVLATILAPLSVHPRFQNQGIGGRLIQDGLKRLKEAGVELVFVLGHPDYYPKYGFSPAGNKGFDASCPIPPENSEAWMVLELLPGVIGHAGGKVICADALNDPKYWIE